MQERRTRWQREGPRGKAFKIDLAKIFVDAGNVVAMAGAENGQESDVQNDATLPGSTLWSMVATDKPFEATLPFHLTEPQRRAIIRFSGALAQRKPMCRLMRGDVGAVRTAVAAPALRWAG